MIDHKEILGPIIIIIFLSYFDVANFFERQFGLAWFDAILLCFLIVTLVVVIGALVNFKSKETKESSKKSTVDSTRNTIINKWSDHNKRKENIFKTSDVKGEEYFQASKVNELNDQGKHEKIDPIKLANAGFKIVKKAKD